MRHHAFVAMVLAAAVVGGAGVVRAGELPRYQLEVGEVLTYENSSTSEAKGQAASAMSGTEQVIVVGKVRDGWKVVTIKKDHQVAAAGTQPAAAAKEEVDLGTEVVMPDGTPTELTEGVGDPSTLFLKLPGTEGELAGYTSAGPSGGTGAFKVTDAGAVTVDFAAPLFTIYHIHRTAALTMDAKQHVPGRIERTTSMDNDGRSSHGTSTMELKGVEQKDAAWAEKFGKDMETLKGATKGYYAVAEKMTGTDEMMKEALAGAQQTFAAAKSGVTTPEVVTEFEGQAKQFGMYQKMMIQEAQRSVAALNKPAVDWTLDEIGGGGGKIALKDLRGKVVLLDFWYKDCPWCIRAMPAIKQVAADYKGKVQVVGMNVDKDEADAKLVIDGLGLNYPSVKTSFDLAKQYGVQVYPTLIVIDQQGIVRKMDTGFTPTLRKDLGDFVNGLLKGNGA